MTMLAELTKLYDAYVDTYRDSSGELPKMMRLKRIHTGFVVKNAEAIADGDYYCGDGDRRAQLSLYRDGLMDPSDPDTAWVGIGEGTDWVYSFFFAWDDKTLSYEVYDRRPDSTGTYFLLFVPIDDESFRLTATGPGDGGEVVFDGVLTKGDPYPD